MTLGCMNLKLSLSLKLSLKMKEIHYTSLREALGRLPEHAPPAAVWAGLEEALDADAALAADMPNLPVYDPPAAIWTQIEAGLETEGRPVSKTIAMWPTARRLSAVAAALALLLAGWWYWAPAKPSGAIVSVHQEVVDNRLLAANTEAEDDAFGMVQELCRTEMPLCDQPEFRSLKTELDELTQAKTELKAALGNFGDDPELHAELARIERERSDVLRQMMSMI